VAAAKDSDKGGALKQRLGQCTAIRRASSAKADRSGAWHEPEFLASRSWRRAGPHAHIEGPAGSTEHQPTTAWSGAWSAGRVQLTRGAWQMAIARNRPFWPGDRLEAGHRRSAALHTWLTRLPVAMRPLVTPWRLGTPPAPGRAIRGSTAQFIRNSGPHSRWRPASSASERRYRDRCGLPAATKPGENHAGTGG